MLPSRTLLVAGSLVAVLLLAGCGGGGKKENSAPSQTAPSGCSQSESNCVARDQSPQLHRGQKESDVQAQAAQSECSQSGTTCAARDQGPHLRRGQIAMLRPLSDQICPRSTDRVVVRVVGLPGERVSVRAGVLYVNGRQLHLRPYLDRPVVARSKRVNFPVQRIPARQYLLLGDALNPACDSRYFGPLPLNFISRPVLPRLAGLPAFRQGYEACADFGLTELSGLYASRREEAIVAAVRAREPSAAKHAIGMGCLAGLRHHRLGQLTAPVPKGSSVDPDEAEGG